MKNKFFIFFLVIILCSCNSNMDLNLDSEKPIVICTTTIIADLARNLSSNHFNIVGIMRAGEDPHTYEPKPLDSLKIKKAKIVLKNGLFLEGTLDKIIKNNIQKDSLNIALAEDERIKIIESEKYKGAPDPHCWFDVSYFKIYAEKCRDAFIKALPKHKADFEKAAEEYIKKLDKLHKYAKEEIAKIPKERRVLITSHDAFKYFGKAYDIEVKAIIGTSTDEEPKPQDVQNLIDFVIKNKIESVFLETSTSENLNKLMGKISTKSNVNIGGYLYSDSLGEENSFTGSYIGVMNYNIKAIVKGLK